MNTPGRTQYMEALTQARGVSASAVLLEAPDAAVNDRQSRTACLVQMMREGLFDPVAAQHTAYGLDEEQLRSVVVDSAMTYEEAVLDGLRDDCPEYILMKQALLQVFYHGFDGQVHQGQIVVDRALIPEVEVAFIAAFQANFPLTSVIPVSRFAWDDDASMNADNSSGFNYRTIFGTDTMSRHAGGRAIDLNPKLNPHFRADGSVVPEGAVWEQGKPGVLTEGDPVVSTLKKSGWVWGANWDPKGLGVDVQHFERP